MADWFGLIGDLAGKAIEAVQESQERDAEKRKESIAKLHGEISALKGMLEAQKEANKNLLLENQALKSALDVLQNERLNTLIRENNALKLKLIKVDLPDDPYGPLPGSTETNATGDSSPEPGEGGGTAPEGVSEGSEAARAPGNG